MADNCHIEGCDNISYDDCEAPYCDHSPTCRKHGRLAGDHFVCVGCIDRYEQDREEREW